jgi:hypothetical protein
MLAGLPDEHLDDVLRRVPVVNIFYEVGPFLYQVRLFKDDLEALTGSSDILGLFPKKTASLAKAYTKHYFEKIFYDDLLSLHLVKK